MAWLSLSPLVAVFIKNTLNQMPSLLSCNTNTVNYNLLHREKKQQQKKHMNSKVYIWYAQELSLL